MSVKDGLSKKEHFKPEAASPPETSKNARPKHDNDMIKRSTKGSK